MSCGHLGCFAFFYLKRLEEYLCVAVVFCKVGCFWNLFLQCPPQELSPGQLSLIALQVLLLGGDSEPY